MAASKKAQRHQSTYEERAETVARKHKLTSAPLEGLNLPDKDLDDLCDETLSETNQPDDEPGKAG